jgi:hypothetical protein
VCCSEAGPRTSAWHVTPHGARMHSIKNTRRSALSSSVILCLRALVSTSMKPISEQYIKGKREQDLTVTVHDHSRGCECVERRADDVGVVPGRVPAKICRVPSCRHGPLVSVSGDLMFMFIQAFGGLYARQMWAFQTQRVGGNKGRLYRQSGPSRGASVSPQPPRTPSTPR